MKEVNNKRECGTTNLENQKSYVEMYFNVLCINRPVNKLNFIC